MRAKDETDKIKFHINNSGKLLLDITRICETSAEKTFTLRWKLGALSQLAGFWRCGASLVGEYISPASSPSSSRRHLASLSSMRADFPRNLSGTDLSCWGIIARYRPHRWFGFNNELISDLFPRPYRTIIQAQSAVRSSASDGNRCPANNNR